MNKLLRKIGWKVEGMDYKDNPTKAGAQFFLKYKSLLIGILKYHKEEWIFEYSEEFKNDNSIKPISDFPDINKTYRSQTLWPFFATRIPTINQSYHLKKIRKANADRNSSVDLLKIFGNETINNPFKLVT